MQVLPTFRGKGGLWTRGAGAAAAAAPKPSSTAASKAGRGTPPTQVPTLPAPTLAHRALTALAGAGKVAWVASQNYDDLFFRAGFPQDRLSEVRSCASLRAPPLAAGCCARSSQLAARSSQLAAGSV